jgi:phosphatidylglycerol:prolipoprotein diacylglycerol transferase
MMLPVLQIGPLAVQTYPLALLLAGWVALATGARLATRLGIEGDHIYNAGLSGLAAGLVVGRLAHLIAFWPAYRLQPWSIIGLNARAFLPWPGVLAGLAVSGYYMYRHRLPLATVLDAAAPGGLLGMAIAQLGAWLAGLEPGAPAGLPWAIAEWGVRRHPVQLYQVAALLAAFGVVLFVLRREHRPGRAAWSALLGYGVSLWLIEPFRESSATLVAGLRTLQLLGLAAILVALVALRPQPEGKKIMRASERSSDGEPG